MQNINNPFDIAAVVYLAQVFSTDEASSAGSGGKTKSKVGKKISSLSKQQKRQFFLVFKQNNYGYYIARSF